MRKALLFAGLLLAITIGAAASTDPGGRSEPAGYDLMINAAGPGDFAPLRLNDDTIMISSKQAASMLGVELSWDPGTRTMSAVKGTRRLDMTEGRTAAVRNGTTLELPAAPYLSGETLYVPLRPFSETFDSIVRWDGESRKVTVIPGSELLPQVKDMRHLKSLLADYVDRPTRKGFDTAAVAESVPVAAAAAVPAGASQASDFSTTNVQVDGVDEGDIVKTDGRYLYQVNGNRIAVVQAQPADQMKLVSTIAAEPGFRPEELYLDEHHLTVIGMLYDNSQSSSKAATLLSRGMTKAVVYDITNKSAIKKVREFAQSGQYVASRKIGTALYLVSNQYIDAAQLKKEDEAVLPHWYDTASGSTMKPVGQDVIRYFPEELQPNFLVIGSIDTEHTEKAVDIQAFVGGGQNVYASTDHLFVAAARQEASAGKRSSQEAVFDGGDTRTYIYRFTLDGTTIRFSGQGSVPGRILNQFSMDEAGSTFRIATTTGSLFGSGEQLSRNHLFVLDDTMSIVGMLDDLAPGEKIYSVRFMGNRAYIVTFKKVDPLFVLDLSNPQSPKVLGKLKIPGYSDYLQPYDATHLIGFGKDAVDAGTEGQPGAIDFAYYQGIKMAMFDVSDVEHPVEMFKASIGDRGTDSELLRNHRALLFSRERGLLAFPVTLMERTEAQQKNGSANEYGQFSFQGAYVYSVDLTNGFRLQTRITHLSEQDQLKSGSIQPSWNDARFVQRALYIGNTLYTLSQSEVLATDLGTYRETGRLLITP